MIQLAYDLISPVEITSFAFHPENWNIVMGGCLNGQVITWDLCSTDHRVGNSSQKEEAPEGEENSIQSTGNIMKSLAMSLIEKSHKSFVSDLAFVPGSVKVDKKNDNKGISEHFVTVSEDGYVCIWDSRHVRKEMLQ